MNKTKEKDSTAKELMGKLLLALPLEVWWQGFGYEYKPNFSQAVSKGPAYNSLPLILQVSVHWNYNYWALYMWLVGDRL